MDNKGYIKIIGHINDIIIKSGVQIYPQEVEDVIDSNPYVLKAYVCGVPDDRCGQEVCAWIQLKDPNKNPTEDEMAMCKVPRYILLVEEFPITRTGMSVNCVPLTQPHIESEWIAFKKQFRDSNEYYERSADEEVKRRQVFEDNYRRIVRHNEETDNGLHTYRLGVNQFSDWTDREYQQWLNRPKPKANQTLYVNTEHHFSKPPVPLPNSVDWRDKHVVTPVKNQANCGGCWVFSTVASLEGQLALKTGKLLSLSEQNILDCDSEYGCESGGFVEHAFDTIAREGGIESESQYPFRNDDDKRCTFKKSKSVASIGKYSTITPGSESSLEHAVATVGPIAVYIDSDAPGFMSYSSGLYSSAKCKTDYNDLLHSVAVVGYGTAGGHDYWLIKNSWDTTWGERGYMRLARNKGNMCGVATFGAWPTEVSAT
ncbi:unnamed protein product [Oppiella nova]|nr:unnamed protein product [Oppiella nova]CAG2166090.1 unnamed protein product [Oppiella nova]